MTSLELANAILNFNYILEKRTKFTLKDKNGCVLNSVDISSKYIINKRFDIIQRLLELLLCDFDFSESTIEIEEIETRCDKIQSWNGNNKANKQEILKTIENIKNKWGQ